MDKDSNTMESDGDSYESIDVHSSMDYYIGYQGARPYKRNKNVYCLSGKHDNCCKLIII